MPECALPHIQLSAPKRQIDRIRSHLVKSISPTCAQVTFGTPRHPSAKNNQQKPNDYDWRAPPPLHAERLMKPTDKHWTTPQYLLEPFPPVCQDNKQRQPKTTNNVSNQVSVDTLPCRRLARDMQSSNCVTLPTVTLRTTTPPDNNKPSNMLDGRSWSVGFVGVRRVP